MRTGSSWHGGAWAGGSACHDCLRKASRGSMPAARRPPPQHPLGHGSEGCGVRETRVKWPTLPAPEGSGRRSGRGPAFCARSLGAALGGEPAHLPSLGLPVWHMSAKRPASWACRERTTSLAQGRTHGKCQTHRLRHVAKDSQPGTPELPRSGLALLSLLRHALRNPREAILTIASYPPGV